MPHAPTVHRSRTEPTAFAQELFAGLPARYDRLGFLLSFGEDRRWRRAVVESAAQVRPRLVLDVATGPAGIALALARRTDARIVGVDVTPAMLLRGKANVERDGRSLQIFLALARGEALPFADATFDAVCFSYLLRYVSDPAATISELARVVRPDGVLAGLEFGVPERAPWRQLWRFHTRVVLPVVGGALGGRAWWQVGRFLGPSISAHYAAFPVAAHVAAWQAAGLEEIRVRRMSVGGGLVMSGRKR